MSGDCTPETKGGQNFQKQGAGVRSWQEAKETHTRKSQLLDISEVVRCGLAGAIARWSYGRSTGVVNPAGGRGFVREGRHCPSRVSCHEACPRKGT